MIVLSLLLLYFGEVMRCGACPSSVMPGIELGVPTDITQVDSVQKQVMTWQNCRDLCCKNNACVAWTLLLAEKICFLRNEIGGRFLENKNQISGITQDYALPAPYRSKRLRFYVGILSAPTYWARVNMLFCAHTCMNRLAVVFESRIWLFQNYKSLMCNWSIC